MLHQTFFVATAVVLITCSNKTDNKEPTTDKTSSTSIFTPDKESIEKKRVTDFASRLKKYAVNNGYNQSVCYLVDMKKESGENRFYVYDLNAGKIIHKALVTHGSCGNSFFSKREYGNTVGCNCSSLGKYKIGRKYYGRFGLAYKLHGLEGSNSKAFERFVVLHAHSCVPDNEVSPFPICLSNGCPTVSPNFLQTLAGFIDKSKQPILLWIFE
jgi:hypothetical protein